MKMSKKPIFTYFRLFNLFYLLFALLVSSLVFLGLSLLTAERQIKISASLERLRHSSHSELYKKLGSIRLTSKVLPLGRGV